MLNEIPISSSKNESQNIQGMLKQKYLFDDYLIGLRPTYITTIQYILKLRFMT